MGRPTKFKREHVEQVRKLCLLGATDKDLANFFGVGPRTISRWSKIHPEFRAARKVAKDEVDEQVERSLFQRAIGYSHPEDRVFAPRKEGAKPVVVSTTKHYPPDPRSMVFWLRNRQPARWRDQRQGEQAGETRAGETEVAKVERVIVDPQNSDG